MSILTPHERLEDIDEHQNQIARLQDPTQEQLDATMARLREQGVSQTFFLTNSGKRSFSDSARPHSPSSKRLDLRMPPAPFDRTSLFAITEPIPVHGIDANPAIAQRNFARSHNHYFIALDLDECSVLGSDTNDIIRLMLTAQRHYDKVRGAQSAPNIIDAARMEEIFHKTAESVVNPAMLRAIREIELKVGHKPYVFAYTNKGTVCNQLQYFLKSVRQCYENLMKRTNISPKDKQTLAAWSRQYDFSKTILDRPEGPTVFLEGSSPDKNYTYLEEILEETMTPIIGMANRYGVRHACNHYLPRVKEMLRNTQPVTWAISKALGLDYNMPAFISSVYFKDLTNIIPTLGLPSIDRIWLYDDKATEHFEKMMVLKYQGRYDLDVGNPMTPDTREMAARDGYRNSLDVHMVPVQPFHTEIMPTWTRSYIQRNLTKGVSQEFLRSDPKLHKQISVADPRWPAHRLLQDSSTGAFSLGAGTIPREAGSAPAESWSTDMFTTSLTTSLPPALGRHNSSTHAMFVSPSIHPYYNYHH